MLNAVEILVMHSCATVVIFCFTLGGWCRCIICHTSGAWSARGQRVPFGLRCGFYAMAETGII